MAVGAPLENPRFTKLAVELQFMGSRAIQYLIDGEESTGASEPLNSEPEGCPAPLSLLLAAAASASGEISDLRLRRAGSSCAECGDAEWTVTALAAPFRSAAPAVGSFVPFGPCR